MFARSILTCTLTMSLSLVTSIATAQQNACRTRCEAREVIDAYGCCAPLELPSPTMTPSTILPDAITIDDEHARPPVTLRAYHMLAPPVSQEDRPTLIAQIIDTTKDFNTRADTISPIQKWLLTDAMSVAAWQVWMTFESELRILHNACSSDEAQRDATQRSACIKDLGRKLKERATWLELARPIWQRAQAPPLNSELSSEPLIGAIRAQAMFYQAAAELAAGQANQGFTLVKSLLTFDAESPYAALASMSLADFFMETGSPQLAAPFYLKAARHPHVHAASYAYYRHGLCLVSGGEWQQGMRMLIRAIEEIQQHGADVQGVALLNKAVTMDIITLYAQTGVAEDAPRFFDALGVPVSLLPIYLERLRDAYDVEERKDESKKLSDLLNSLQDSSPGVGTSMPRSR